MAGARGSALEWAMALLREPARRHALRQRPLPGGMTQLLVVASDADSKALSATAKQ